MKILCFYENQLHIHLSYQILTLFIIYKLFCNTLLIAGNGWYANSVLADRNFFGNRFIEITIHLLENVPI